MDCVTEVVLALDFDIQKRSGKINHKEPITRQMCDQLVGGSGFKKTWFCMLLVYTRIFLY